MERIDLAGVRHAERQLWRNGDLWDERATKVAVGETEDGRWYAELWGRCARPISGCGTCAYPGPKAEHYARATARRWMRTVGGEWVEA